MMTFRRRILEGAHPSTMLFLLIKSNTNVLDCLCCCSGFLCCDVKMLLFVLYGFGVLSFYVELQLVNES